MIEVHLEGTLIEWIVTIAVVSVIGGFLSGFFGAMGRDLRRRRDD